MRNFERAVYRVTHAADQLYLDGISIYDVVEHQFLVQLHDFSGYGFCYEAAALAMFLLKDNKTARLVQGTAECHPSTHERCDHAWVEFEEGGVPFAIDFTWFEEEFCLPRYYHVDIVKSLVYHTCSYTQFWQMPLSKTLYALVHERKSSYIMPWLFLYRSPKGEYGLPLADLSSRICFNDKFCPTGKEKQYMYFTELILRKQPSFLPAELKYVT